MSLLDLEEAVTGMGWLGKKKAAARPTTIDTSQVGNPPWPVQVITNPQRYVLMSNGTKIMVAPTYRRNYFGWGNESWTLRNGQWVPARNFPGQLISVSSSNGGTRYIAAGGANCPLDETLRQKLRVKYFSDIKAQYEQGAPFPTAWYPVLKQDPVYPACVWKTERSISIDASGGGGE